jgi:hypothetical protein
MGILRDTPVDQIRVLWIAQRKDVGLDRLQQFRRGMRELPKDGL